MRGAESIIDKKIPKLGQRSRKPLVVFLFAAQEARVLEEENLSGPEVLAGLERFVRIGRLNEDHRASGELLEPIRYRLQRVLRIGLPLGPSEVRENHWSRAALEQQLDRRK